MCGGEILSCEILYAILVYVRMYRYYVCMSRQLILEIAMLGNIIVQHGHRAPRKKSLVRCDITAFIGFILPKDTPEGFQVGDFFEVVIRGEREFANYALASVFDKATKRAIISFFQNGGDVAHVFGVCVSSLDDLTSALSVEEVCENLFQRLEAEEDISLLYIPVLGYFNIQMFADGQIFSSAEALLGRFLLHCSVMNNRFLLIDSPRDLHDDLLVRWVKQLQERQYKNASYGAIYYPWLRDGEDVYPPGAAMAGLFVAVEQLHPPIGIQWPPANIALRGVSDTLVPLEQEEATFLAQAHVNPIYVVPGRGIMPMGARTLSKDPIFQQINSRRIMNMIVEQLYRDSQWAVFEVNNPHLWSVVTRDVKARLEEFWLAGLLTLSKDGEKYYVRCNAENNPMELLSAGFINIEVRVQPVGTTEQILIDLNVGGT